jgi:ribosome maturation factor RimP
MPVLGSDTTADYGMGLAPIFFSAFSAAARRRTPSEAVRRAGAEPVDERCFRFAATEERRRIAMTNEELNELLAPLIADLGLELVGIEFRSHAGGAMLRVYIDEPERGVTIDDCERASREISALLDVNDPISSRYTLEVSSPGLERPLFTLEHFTRFLGEQVKVGVNLPLDGRRRFQGRIASVDGDRITIDQDGTPVEIAHANIAKANLVPDYAALGLAPPRAEPAGRARPARPRRR